MDYARLPGSKSRPGAPGDSPASVRTWLAGSCWRRLDMWPLCCHLSLDSFLSRLRNHCVIHGLDSRRLNYQRINGHIDKAKELPDIFDVIFNLNLSGMDRIIPDDTNQVQRLLNLRRKPVVLDNFYSISSFSFTPGSPFCLHIS